MTEIKRLFDISQNQLAQNESAVVFVTKYNGVWKKTTSKEFVESANNLSKSLLQLGVKPFDKIAIITDRTRTEWNITDLAILQIGAQSVPVYDSTSISEMNYIFNHAEVKYCFVSNKELLNKVLQIKNDVKSLFEIITFDEIINKISINKLIKYGAKLDNFRDVELIKNNISENDIATIIYTSGTTNLPKGAIITHKNILSVIKDSLSSLPKNIILKKSLSLLPVSHIFERMMLYIYQVNSTTIFYAESIETVANDMKYVKPNVISLVPRLLEKIYDKIIEKGNSLKGIKKRLFNWAMDIGGKFEPDGLNGSKYERNLKRSRKLIFKKWQEAFGGNINLLICGGSKLQPKLARIFNAAGLYVMEGYGLTESSAVVAVNSRKKGMLKIGSVGKPIHSNHVMISNDGEVLIKGDNIIKSYFKDEEKTRNGFTNGFFKTGDLGRIDSDGFLFITGRKKDIFKTSGGKYIAPIKIENELKKSAKIEQVVIIGENEKFPAAIIQPNFELLKNKFPQLTDIEIIKNQKVIHLFQQEIDLVNKSLGQWEKIKRFKLTPDEWTTNAGHLTPTLKVKRDIIKTKYYILYNKIYRPIN